MSNEILNINSFTNIIKIQINLSLRNEITDFFKLEIY